MKDDRLRVGSEFGPVTYKLDEATITKYIEAVESANEIWRTKSLVPPTAIAAYAMRVLIESLSLPPGAIHTTQELEFLKLVPLGSEIACQARVIQNQTRGNLHLLTFDLNAFDQDRDQVLCGKATIVLTG